MFMFSFNLQSKSLISVLIMKNRNCIFSQLSVSDRCEYQLRSELRIGSELLVVDIVLTTLTSVNVILIDWIHSIQNVQR